MHPVLMKVNELNRLYMSLVRHTMVLVAKDKKYRVDPESDSPSAL